MSCADLATPSLVMRLLQVILKSVGSFDFFLTLSIFYIFNNDSLLRRQLARLSLLGGIPSEASLDFVI